MRLTAEQQKLAASAFRLAIKIAHKSALYRFDREAAEEVALHALCSAAVRYAPERGTKFTTYAGKAVWKNLHREGAHLADKRSRRHRAGFREVGLTDGWHPSTFDPEPEIEVEEREGVVRDAVAALPPDERELIEARFYRGETIESLAARAGISAAGLRDRILRVLESLQYDAKFKRFAFN